MVVHVADSPRRVDKTAILRLSAHSLRLGHVFNQSDRSFTDKAAIPDALLHMMNGFMLTITCAGQIVLVSSSLEQYLGHCQVSGRMYV